MSRAGLLSQPSAGLMRNAMTKRTKNDAQSDFGDVEKAAAGDARAEMAGEKAVDNETLYQPGHDWKRGAVRVSDLLPKFLDPIYARKGMASSALTASWPELAGPMFADCTLIETIQWPHQRDNGSPSYQGGVLVVRVDGPQAIYLQHEERQIIERVNQFFGFHAITRIKIVQAPIARKAKPEKPTLPDLSPSQDRKLRECVVHFEDPALNEAVLAMGRGVLQRLLTIKKS